MIDGHVRKFHYNNGKLIKACDFNDVGKERNCDTYRYLEDGTFEHNTNFNVGRANFTYDKNHNELKRQIFDEYERLKETLTIRHKFDKHDNINNSEKSEDGEPLYDAFTQHTLPSHVLSTSEGGYEEVEMSSTTKAAMQWILDNRRRLFLEHGVDVVRALSVMGENKDAQNNLQIVCYGNSEFREILDDIRKLSAVRCLNMSVTDLFKPHVNDPFLHDRGLSRA